MTPGVVKTAAKAFPDVAAQCQEKESADLRTTQTPPEGYFSSEIHRRNFC